MRTDVSPHMYSVHYVCIMCGKIAAVTDSVNRKLTATVCVTVAVGLLCDPQVIPRFRCHRKGSKCNTSINNVENPDAVLKNKESKSLWEVMWNKTWGWKHSMEFNRKLCAAEIPLSWYLVYQIVRAQEHDASTSLKEERKENTISIPNPIHISRLGWLTSSARRSTRWQCHLLV